MYGVGEGRRTVCMRRLNDRAYRAAVPLVFKEIECLSQMKGGRGRQGYQVK